MAAEITRIHSTHTGEPASFVWVIFETVSPDSTFIGGKPAVNALIVGIFREDRSTEVKAQVLNELWSRYKNVTGLSDDQLWVSLTEIPRAFEIHRGEGSKCFSRASSRIAK